MEAQKSESQQRLFNSIGMQLQFYTHSGETIEMKNNSHCSDFGENLLYNLIQEIEALPSQPIK